MIERRAVGICIASLPLSPAQIFNILVEFLSPADHDRPL
jgi:hypothetical protein